MKIVIGRTAKNKSLGIDLDTLITTRLLIQANSGAGKSYLLRKLMEELFGHIQIIAIDPEGEFATLREKYGFVLVGKGGETPADARTAETVAHKLLELRASAICDLYEMRSQDRHAWVKTFLEAMINAPKKLWHPVIMIVDEAHIFCPEKGSGESAAKESMIDLTTRGRKRGFCAIWATQRLAKVDKDATSGLLNRLVGGTFEDVDIKRALDLLSVPPEEQIRGQASRLKSRVERLLEREDAPIDVNVRLQAQEPVTITPRDLPPKREARSLPEVTGNGEVSGSQMKILQALAMFASINRFDVPKKWIAAMAGASHSSSSFGNNLSALRTRGLIDYGLPGTARLTPAGLEVAPQVEPPSDPSELIDRCKEIISSSQGRILDALIAQYPNAVDKKELANIAGASSSSSSYGNNLSALRSAGMIDYTSAGTARAADWLFLE